jgi:flavin-dependent dehydrogenase
MAWRQRVVVVGAGFGGIAVARALRKERMDVLLIDRNNHHVFQPLLYQVATCALSPSEIAFPVRSIFAKQWVWHYFTNQGGARLITGTRNPHSGWPSQPRRLAKTMSNRAPAAVLDT